MRREEAGGRPRQRRLTSSFSWRDGGTLVFDVQSAGGVEDRVHEDVGLALLQHVQHLLQQEQQSPQAS